MKRVTLTLSSMTPEAAEVGDWARGAVIAHAHAAVPIGPQPTDCFVVAYLVEEPNLQKVLDEFAALGFSSFKIEDAEP